MLVGFAQSAMALLETLVEEEAMLFRLCTWVWCELDIAMFEVGIVHKLGFEDICILNIAKVPSSSSDLS